MMRPSLLALALPAVAAAADSIAGQATIVEGDTIIVERVKPRIRFHGIDAPEKKQTCEDEGGERYLRGGRAANALAEILGRDGCVRCTEEDGDRYGRIVAECTMDGVVINKELVQRGWALEYDDYSDGRFAAAQEEARQVTRGLWAKRFRPSWKWRREQRLR